MHKVRLKLLLALCLASVATVFAGPVSIVTIDTSSLSGTTGAIYFQFAGGLNPDPASVSISNFSMDAPGALDPAAPGTNPLTDGGVSGSLLAPPLIIDNSGGLNDYTHFLTFGSHISFQVGLNFPTPLVGDSGSDFLFAVTGPDGITPLLVSSPSDYFLGDIGYDLNGVVTATALLPAAQITSAVPEPSYGVGIFVLLLAVFLVHRRLFAAS